MALAIPEPSPAVALLVHRRLLIAVAAPFIHAGLYFLGNHLPLGVPMTLPLSRIDLAVPLVPATVWIYLSDYLLVFIAFFLCRYPLRFALSFFSVIAICVFLQWLIPIEFPRALFPLDGQGLSVWGLGLLRQFDAPVSCFPSLHVAVTCVGVLEVRRAPPAPWVTPALAFWGLAICASTLTTKQHYAIDIAAGAMVAWAVVVLNRAALKAR